MNVNPVEAIPELKNQSSPQIIFGTEVDEQFLLSMYDSVEASIFVVDVLEDGDFRYFALNPTHERWIGIRSEELRGKKPEDILSPVDAARVRQHYADCVQFGKTISYEQCLQFQGTSTWWSTTLTPLRDGNSRIYRLIGTSSKITPAKLAEAAKTFPAERERLLEGISHQIRQAQDLEVILQQTVQEIRPLLESDRVLIYQFISKNQGVVTAESTLTATSLLGYDFQDFCFTAKQHQRYRRGFIHVVEDIYAAGLHPQQIELFANLQVRANLVVPILLQQDLWGLLIVQNCHQPRQWQQPEIDLLKQTATQIGIAAQQAALYQQVRQLQTQLELQQQQHRTQLQQVQNFQALVRRLTEQIRDSQNQTQILQTIVEELAQLLKLERCQIELYNPSQTLATVSCEYTTSLPHCQGLTRQIADFAAVYQPLLQKQPLQSWEIVPGWHPELLIVTQLACPIFDAQGILGNIWLIRPTQAAFAELEIALVQQVASECAIAIRQAQLYQTTKSQQGELEKRERLKNEFLRTLSHELRTPVTSISLAAQTLESLLTPNGILDKELVPQLLQILQTECGRESKLINDLLTLTYLKTEPAPPTLIAIDLQTWLPPIVESFRQLTSCQRQQLNLEISADIPPLETDITDLERIVSELLNHACKCTPEGEAITISAYLKAGVVQLSFRNSGVEIKSHELGQIFQPFYRIAKNAPWKSSDTGLELALVKTMVKHLGGSIVAESAGNAITFTLKFPL
jgi:PAS domain S-box-containing protein